MKIRINDMTYSDCLLGIDAERGRAVITLRTGDSISAVASLFDGEDRVTALDDSGAVTGVWYVHTLASIHENWESRAPGEPREIVVVLKASALADGTEETLGSSIGENTDAILELGGLVADMKDFDTRLNLIEGALEGIPKDIAGHFYAIESAYNALADRVSELENGRE